ncbi:MAG: thioredoxin domain-containing protein [Planctomycetota bacterium]
MDRKWMSLCGGLGGLALLGGAAVNVATGQSTGSELPQADLYAIHTSADWCPHCQKINATIPDVHAALADKDVLFLDLDVTNKQAKHQSALHVEALGLDSFFETSGRKHGRLYLVRPSSGEVLETITSSATAEEIVATINAAI